MGVGLGIALAACGDDRPGPTDGRTAVDAAAIDAAADAPIDAEPDAPIDGAPVDGPAVDAPVDGPVDAPAIDATPAEVDLAALDPGFGGQGFVDLMAATGAAVAIQPDQKVVVCAAGSLASALYRLRPDGALDPTFAGGAPIPAGSSGCADVAILADGRIAVASFPGGADSLVAADGSTVTTLVRPTSTFGLATSHFLPTHDGGFFVAMDEVHLTPPALLTKTSAVARYDATGALVPSFGQAGLALLPFTVSNPLGLDDRQTQVALASVAGADHLVVATPRTNIVALDPATGAIDGTFATTAGDNLQPLALIADAQGRVIAAWGEPFGSFMARTKLRAITVDGQVSGQLSTTYCGSTPERAAIAGLSLDASQRPVFVLRASRDHVTIQLARGAADVTSVDGAWSCARSFRLPSLCPPVGACDQQTTAATDSAMAADGSVVVVGDRWRAGTAARVFVARVRGGP